MKVVKVVKIANVVIFCLKEGLTWKIEWLRDLDGKEDVVGIS